MAKKSQYVNTDEQTGAQTDKKDTNSLLGSAFGVQSWGGATGTRPTFKIYRQMRENPTVALARMVATAPIRTAEWTLEADDGVPEEQVEFIQDNLTALWHNLVNDSLLALDYGYAPGEIIFEESEGQVSVARVKPLLVDKTTILTDEHGNFTGLKNQVGKFNVELDAAESFLYSYDCEAGNLYGRSRNENIRATAWQEWVDLQRKRALYFRKSAGAVPMIHYPDGEGIDAGGAVRPNYQLAKLLVDHLQKGNGICMPTTLKPWAQELARDGKAGADMEAWTIDFLETKSQHGAEFTDAMKHCESLMMRGWLIPERSATEAQTAGSRADSETSADIALTCADLVLHDLCQTFQCQIINPLLVLNYGDQAKGTVRIKRAGLSAPLQAFYRALIQAALGNPTQLALLLKLVDMNSLVSAAGLPAPETVPTTEELEATVASSRPSSPGDEPGGGEPDKPLSMTDAVAEVYRSMNDDLEFGGPGSGRYPAGSGGDLSEKAKAATAKTKGLVKHSDEANEAHNQAAESHRAAADKLTEEAVAEKDTGKKLDLHEQASKHKAKAYRHDKQISTEWYQNPANAHKFSALEFGGPGSGPHAGELKFEDPEEGELCKIDIDNLEFKGGLSDEVTKLNDNKNMPIIVRETPTGYRIQDGFGRASGMKNAGKESVHAIIVSKKDVEARGQSATDDAEWVQKMHQKYAPDSTLA